LSTERTQSSVDAPELRRSIERVVASRVRDPHVVEDLVQETLTRLLVVHPRLDADAVIPYATVIAQNIVTSHARQERRWRRHRHRVLDLTEPSRPEEKLLQHEDAEAVSAALGQLSERERQAVVAHELDGVGTGTVAASQRSTPGAVAVRLARARAKLRVDYVIALRRAKLPTSRCRPVLLSLSAADTGRQRQLGAGRHLLECPTCAALSEPLVTRRRASAVLWPLLAIASVLRRLRQWGRHHPVHASVAAGTAVAATAVVVALGVTQPSGAPPPPATPPTTASTSPLLAQGEPVLPLPPGRTLARYAGQEVRGRRVPVQSVASDEGFWVGPSETQRVWVQLTGAGESPFVIRRGQRVSFTGRMVPNPPGFAGAVGVDPAEGAALLEAEAQQVEVPIVGIRAG